MPDFMVKTKGLVWWGFFYLFYTPVLWSPGWRFFLMRQEQLHFCACHTLCHTWGPGAGLVLGAADGSRPGCSSAGGNWAHRARVLVSSCRDLLPIRLHLFLTPSMNALQTCGWLICNAQPEQRILSPELWRDGMFKYGQLQAGLWLSGHLGVQRSGAPSLSSVTCLVAALTGAPPVEMSRDIG